MVNKYNWKRFWCPRDGSIDLSDDGFLCDPETEFFKYVKSDVVSFEEIADKPCLILLGEPGIGKSIALSDEFNILSKQNHKCFYKDLGLYGNETRLISEIFKSPEFEEWGRGNYTLHLFLDSLDECKIRIEQVGLIFKDEFEKIKDKLNRLHLRIASRTVDFPGTLENALPTLWDKDSIGIYEMAPLRKKDVKEAANANSIDSEQFIQLLIEKEIVPLAIKPITLDFIIKIYKEKGALPASKLELYKIGCKKLCEESNLSRRESSNAVNVLTKDQKNEIAGKIAAVSIFCKKPVIYIGMEQPLTNDEISISEILRTDKSLSRLTIREVLNTGLFSGRDTEKFGFAHQTYAEYLAASFINTCEVNLSEILKLFTHSSCSNNPKIIPQLSETVAWFAVQNRLFFDVLVENDPEVLLRGDLSGADHTCLKLIIERILLKAESVEIKASSIDSYYHKLKHPDLHIQLKPFLEDKNKHFLARRIAIDIIEACNEKRSLPGLISIVFNKEEAFQLRKNAAYAIARIGDSESKLSLKHFIVNQEDDPDDELKGCALKSLWPDYLSMEELFENLTFRRNSNLVGAYSIFLYHLKDTVEHIPPCELIYALNWIQLGYWEDFSFREIKDSIMIRAWIHLLEIPELIGPFAKALYTVLSRYHGISSDKDKDFNATIIAEEDKRHEVTKAIIPLFIQKEGNIHLLFSIVPLAVEYDLPWLCNQCQGINDENEKKLWCQLIGYLCRGLSPKYLDTIIRAKSSDSDISEALSFLDPIVINSPEGRKVKAEYLKHKRLMNKLNSRQDKPLLKPSPVERVIQLLKRFEEGEKNAWWQLNIEMTLEPNSKYYGDEFESDIRKLPVWQQADIALQTRLLSAAKKYIQSPPDLDSSWIGDTLDRVYMAGYRAFALIINLEPKFISSLNQTVWKTWAPTFIAYPLNNDENNEPHVSLMKKAYENAPDEILHVFSRMVDKDNEERNHIFLKQRLLNCWDEKLASLLFEKTQASHIKYESKENLYDSLFDHNYSPAVEFAKGFVSKPIPTEGDMYKLYVYLTTCLIICCPEDAGKFIFPKINENEKFGHDLIKKISKEREYRHGNISVFASRIPEEDIAKLYVWIEERYPQKGDPIHHGAYSPGDRDNIVEFRNGLVRNLTDRGTFEACKQLGYIYQQFPEKGWLKWSMIDARENALRNTWVPITPEQLLSLFSKSALYIVRNEDDLQEVVIGWFRKFQEELQGETYAAPDLWNTNKPMQPKGENNFSDYVKRNLQRDIKNLGIAALREVEVRKGLGNSPGEETDIYITAFISGELLEQKQKIVVIIESKGCWHPEVLTAMETQLVNRYLKDNQCRHGIYLVGWFGCKQCQKTNCKTKICNKGSIDDLRKQLDEQAISLSTRGLKIKSLVANAALR